MIQNRTAVLNLLLLAYPQRKKRNLAYPLINCEEEFYGIFIDNLGEDKNPKEVDVTAS